VQDDEDARDVLARGVRTLSSWTLTVAVLHLTIDSYDELHIVGDLFLHLCANNPREKNGILARWMKKAESQTSVFGHL
jgi:hypothetical protein